MSAGRRRLLGFVGDVMVDRDEPDTAFDLARGALTTPDLLFGNCECVFTDDRRHLAPSAAVVAIAPSAAAAALGPAGFDVMSLANNHIVDAGHEGIDTTAGLLGGQGIQTVGAGRNLTEARRPATLRTGDVTVAYLAYASFFPSGYEARDDWPGLAPVRSRNHYVERFPNLWAPGTPPVCSTVPVPEDMERLEADLVAARQAADIVVASFHWGDYQRPYDLTDHEVRTAHFAVGCGADVVVGHHHHMLRGVEWYRDRPIFYGLGHFVFDFALPESGPAAMVDRQVTIDPGNDTYYGLAPRQGWPLHPWHPDARMTALAWVGLDGTTIDGAGFLPCRLNPAGQVEPLDPSSPAGAAVVEYVRTGCDTQDLGVELVNSPDVVLGGLPTVEVVAESHRQGAG
ncbi:MAG: CapA family protein [Pseudonocardiaceae bacterium]|nr:CapA family protein [Pseudonocardiaceae bacterium]